MRPSILPLRRTGQEAIKLAIDHCVSVYIKKPVDPGIKETVDPKSRESYRRQIVIAVVWGKLGQLRSLTAMTLILVPATASSNWRAHVSSVPTRTYELRCLRPWCVDQQTTRQKMSEVHNSDQ